MSKPDLRGQIVETPNGSQGTIMGRLKDDGTVTVKFANGSFCCLHYSFITEKPQDKDDE